jgi:hypothetical protein
MSPRIRKLLQPVAFLAPPATALLGLSIGMGLGAVLIVPPKKSAIVAPSARAQQAQAPRATSQRGDVDRRMVMQGGI